MSQAMRRLSALRRDIHGLKAKIRLNAHPDDPEWYIEELEQILVRDQERIEHRGLG